MREEPKRGQEVAPAYVYLEFLNFVELSCSQREEQNGGAEEGAQGSGSSLSGVAAEVAGSRRAELFGVLRVCYALPGDSLRFTCSCTKFSSEC